MNYYEPNINRLLKTFYLQKADRVPNFEFIINERAVQHILGKPAGETLNLKSKDHIELAQRIGMDAIGFGIYFSPGRVSNNASNGSSHYIDGSIKGWDDLAKIGKPDFTESFNKLERYLEAIQGTNIGVWIYTHGPFDPVYLGMGFQDFCLKIYDDLKFVEYFMDYILEVQCEIVDTLSKMDVSFIHIVDDVAINTGLIIMEDMFKELWIPRLRKLIEPAKKKNIPITFHSDGKLDTIIPILIDLGFCAVNPIEPIANDIYKIKEKFGEKICLMGNIDIAGPLAFGNTEDVIKDVKEHIERLSAKGGYVVSSSSSITDGVKPENFLAMVKAVHKYGKY
ncbi:hypothetical protein KAW08_01070 [bacterium]|nr:hypothetical protein [bacterium]